MKSINQRPILNKELDYKTFRNYYYLKEELVDFCRANNIPVSGSKIQLTDRIAEYLKSGKIIKAEKVYKRKLEVKNIEEDTIIESDFVCSEKHREFFKSKIGKSFSFNVAFQKWLRNNSGKTYGQAIEMYYNILEEKKKGKTKIDKQFEYNTYIRDFFKHNKSKTLNDAIKCWKYKKSMPGHNRYEDKDLDALDKIH